MVLVMLILIIEGVNAYLPHLIEKKKFDSSGFDEEITNFQKALARADSVAKEKKEIIKKSIYQYPNYSYKKKADPAKPPMMVEINTADSAELVGLYGIGAVFADRILNYRGLLGGFYKKEQLLEVYGMDSVRYNQIKQRIKTDTAKIKKFLVNEAEFKILLRHPYLDYETVKGIVNYRQYQGMIENADSLKRIIGYDPIFDKVSRYVDY